ncbi:MAG: DNA adenine methylase [Treponema sp.]|nr:DNA adenine methylase [Treponema sp.]MBR6914193.1 DNA adenine methylase [Treponema sp.]
MNFSPDTKDFSTPYLTEQIIAYIGNKRKLLPLIYSAIENTGLELKAGLKFFDIFSGSGVVSRMAKSLGFEVYTNDWECYANVIAKGYIGTNESDVTELFGSEEKFNEKLNEINSLKNPTSEEQYIAKYYAPKEFDSGLADFNTERLFYTRQNALAIDKIRNYIEKNYSERENPSNLKEIEAENKKNEKIKNLLLSVLIYEAATHTNTSGVFKAFHKGFGGHGKDALKRIMTGIKLSRPPLIDSTQKIHIFQENANEVVKKVKGIDIAYLDPPYNQHQYGSNYHLLNTIAKWDHIPAPLTLNSKGVLKEKAAIRHDWVNTKSDYCYKEIAEKSFSELIGNIDAKHILISYSTDGIIPFEKMREICTKKGKLTIVTNEYSTYRGGKRSNSRQNTNIEFILCIDTTKKNDEESLKKIDAILMRKKLMLLFKQKFSEKKIIDSIKKFNASKNSENGEKRFFTKIEIKDMPSEIPIENPTKNSKSKSATNDAAGETKKKRRTAKKASEKAIAFEGMEREIFVPTKNFFELEPPGNAIELSIEELEEIRTILEPCTCATKEEELAELISKVKTGNVTLNFARKLPSTLKNLAHKKNKEAFQKWLKKIEALSETVPEIYEKISGNVENVKAQAQMRFAT